MNAEPRYEAMMDPRHLEMDPDSRESLRRYRWMIWDHKQDTRVAALMTETIAKELVHIINLMDNLREEHGIPGTQIVAMWKMIQAAGESNENQ